MEHEMATAPPVPEAAVVAVEEAEKELMRQQIKDPNVAAALAYKVRGQPLLIPTYRAYLMFILEMSRKGEPMEIVKSGLPELFKPDGSDRSTWFWRSHKVLRNKRTGHESEGMGHVPYIGGGEFPDRVCLSQSDRNAIRGQIPELALRRWLTAAIQGKAGAVKDVEPKRAEPAPKETATREQVEEAARLAGLLEDEGPAREARKEDKRKTVAAMSRQAADAHIKALVGVVQERGKGK